MWPEFLQDLLFLPCRNPTRQLARDLMVLIQHLEFQQGRVLDEGLGPPWVFHARQLHDDLPKALLLDQRLGHAELVHAVPDGFEGLADGRLLDPFGFVGFQGKDQRAITGRPPAQHRELIVGQGEDRLLGLRP